MDDQKRAPSVDMPSTEVKDMLSPAPTYSSTFILHNIPLAPRRDSFAGTPQSGTSSNPYHQPTTPEPLSSIRHSSTRSSSKDAEEAHVKPDYQDTNHPHFARSSGPGFPTTLPTRSQMPQKCILVPWVLFAVFFLITIWFTSILLGARFLSIIHQTSPALTVQNVHFYVNGEAVQGSVLVFTRTVTLPTGTLISTSKSPSPTEPISQILPDMSKGMDGLSTSIKRRAVPAPTGFTTITRGP
ncbi:hypothetical protein G6011_07796 [Alternaria panax]|uniref:Uncharacterized protein n=1 Tax=Alternaria panax TaxID=48097 RepID=A0AAD4F8R1_9PLEO|nr:hypothetical protein G6011_07796 [Alternaria panax]